MAKAFSKQGRSGGAAARRRNTTKCITFNPNGNKVRFVRVPPRSQNRHFWFTESQRVVRKGLQFELEPDINTELATDGRVQLTAIMQSVGTSSSHRAFVEVREEGLSLGGPYVGSWICIGSVAAGSTQRVRVILPVGSYQLRCVGGTAVQVVGQVWDVERELK